MPKSIVNDVLPPSRRSIRQIPVSKNRKRPVRIHTSRDTDEAVSSPPFIPSLPPEAVEDARPPRRNGRWIFLLILLLSAAGIIFAFSSAFAGATITITPKTERLSIDAALRAEKSAGQTLRYELLPLQGSVSETIPANGTREVERRASGTIVIFNDFSAEPQRLIKNTRFETPSGLIYRIDKSVVVPGKTTKNGESIPGTLEAVVFADAAGEKYNIGQSDFTIPGFKSDKTRYEKFFARGKTAMTGGFIGTEQIVSEEALASTRKKLQETLSKRLKDEAAGNIPDGFLLYDGASTISFESLPQKEAGNAAVEITEKASFTGFLLPRNEIEQKLITSMLPKLKPDTAFLRGTEALTFTLRGKAPRNNEPLEFSLKGTTTAIWKFDEKKLASDLSGQPKKNVRAVLAEYTSIVKTDIVTRPFWRKSLPEKERKIEIKTLLPEDVK